MGQLLNKAVKLVKKPLDSDEIIFKNGDTDKIIEVVLLADKEAANERFLKDFAPLLRGKTDLETCRNVWKFFRDEIPYKLDKRGFERIRLPNKCLFDAYRYNDGGDCKTFSVTEVDILRELGIKVMYRFISQNPLRKVATHVYTVAILKDGTEVVCDGVYALFNKNPNYYYKWDFEAAKLKETHNIGQIGGGTVKFKSYEIF